MVWILGGGVCWKQEELGRRERAAPCIVAIPTPSQGAPPMGIFSLFT